jgi:hypothetical protein
MIEYDLDQIEGMSEDELPVIKYYAENGIYPSPVHG